jgi:hypothetical protein
MSPMSDQDVARIEKLEARLEEMRPLMDDKKKAIIRATADALAAFWPDFVSECVRASGEKLSTLPREEVTRIKAEVAAVTADPESAAQGGLERPDWPHEWDMDRLLSDEVGGSPFTGNLRPYEWLPHKGRGGPRGSVDPPSAMDGAVKVAAAAPAVPISSADLETPRAGASSGKPLTAWDFKWSEEMLSAATSYGELVTELGEVVRNLREARKSRDRNDAQDIWDSA